MHGAGRLYAHIFRQPDGSVANFRCLVVFFTLYIRPSLSIMLSLVFLGFSSCVAGAVLDVRDAVPAGYVAPPYYPAPYVNPSYRWWPITLMGGPEVPRSMFNLPEESWGFSVL
jgi:hypothetical protein